MFYKIILLFHFLRSNSSQFAFQPGPSFLESFQKLLSWYMSKGSLLSNWDNSVWVNVYCASPSAVKHELTTQVRSLGVRRCVVTALHISIEILFIITGAALTSYTAFSTCIEATWYFLDMVTQRHVKCMLLWPHRISGELFPFLNSRDTVVLLLGI